MFSIVICTYNPDELILQRLFAALANNAVTAESIQYEVIIVDNNSKVPVERVAYVKAFADTHKNTRFVKETRPGLTSARIAGVKTAIHEWVIFFDDDNEPADDYLISAQKIIQQYPTAGILGPGRVKVEFTGTVDKFAEGHRELFQERNMTETILDNVRWGQNAYPYGTGMIVRKDIMDEYIRLVDNGTYTMSDRVGKSLISGGDTQILLTGVKMGYYGGSSPEIKLTHLIKPDKTEFKNILRLSYMLSASSIKAYNQVFPEEPFEVVPISNKYVLKTFYSQLRMYLFKKSFKQVAFFLTKRLGELQAHIIAADRKKGPVLLDLYYKLIS